jgi:predicted nucleotidyltransferase component of viral defense system
MIMLSFDEIRRQFDDTLAGMNAFRSMVKEYLQCLTLSLIYQGPFKKNLILIGGTKLRLVDRFRRFSEDLDFDISGTYGKGDHQKLCENLVNGFERMNIRAEVDSDKKLRTQGAFTGYLNFPGILDRVGLKDVPNRKFFIKLDAEKHDFGSFSYKPRIEILNRFDVFTPVACAPNSVILATKLCSILERSKGRDFYDIVELVKISKPDLEYMKNRLQYGRMKQHYTGPETYVSLVRQTLETVRWEDKTAEIEKFLFRQEEALKVTMFPDFASDANITAWLSEGD